MKLTIEIQAPKGAGKTRALILILDALRKADLVPEDADIVQQFEGLKPSRKARRAAKRFGGQPTPRERITISYMQLP